MSRLFLTYVLDDGPWIEYDCANRCLRVMLELDPDHTMTPHIDVDGETIFEYKMSHGTRFHNSQGQVHRLGGPAMSGRGVDEYWINQQFLTPIRFEVQKALILHAKKKGPPVDLQFLSRLFYSEDGFYHAEAILGYIKDILLPPPEDVQRVFTNAQAYWQIEFGFAWEKDEWFREYLADIKRLHSILETVRA